MEGSEGILRIKAGEVGMSLTLDLDTLMEFVLSCS